MTRRITHDCACAVLGIDMPDDPCVQAHVGWEQFLDTFEEQPDE